VIKVREAVEETKEHGLQVKAPKTRAGRRDIGLPDIVVDTLRDHCRAQLELRIGLGAGKLPVAALVFPTIERGLQASSDASRAWGLVADGLGMPEIPSTACATRTHRS
jgi:hypothetical protein